MIRGILVLAVLGAIVAIVLWERSDREMFRKVFFALYNYALEKAKAKSKDTDKNVKLESISINILEIMDQLDVGPRKISEFLEKLEKKEHITMKHNTVKLTPVGIAYFKFKYLNEGGKLV